MKYSKTYLKNVERFYKQKERMSKIQTAYDTHTQRYYAKSKRHNLLSNQYEQFNNINPLSLKPSQLNQLLRDNAKAIRELGFNSSMTGDLAEASVLVELNNEAYTVVDFSDSEDSFYDAEYLSSEQDRVFGEILRDSLLELRLTPYQLEKVLSRSILPDYIVDMVKDAVLNHYKKLRK